MIILTNDDGRDAEGFGILKRAVSAHVDADIWEAAPVGNWSGAGSTIKLRGLVGPHSSPLDHLRLALWEFAMPDWVFAGLNDGANIGRSILTSGTVCLAAYAAEGGIPAAAFSQHRGSSQEFDKSPERLREAIRKVLAHPPLPGTFYNINLPRSGVECKGVLGVAERGKGGYIPTFSDDGERGVVWDGSGGPEKLLDDGYIVCQIMKPFSCI